MKNSKGTVLIITGPESSGKTTFVATVLARYPNWYTINRKKHLKEAFRSPEIINEFLGSAFKDIERISGQKINNLSEFYFEKIAHLDLTSRQAINELVGKVVSISNTQAFRERALLKAFSGYCLEIMPIVISGGNVIIDDSAFIDSPKIFKIFKQAMHGYPHIRLALLKNTLTNTFANCQSRNRKYKDIAMHLATYREVNEASQKMEHESGGSSSSFRFPKEILQNYHKLYDFNTNVSMSDIVVEVLTRRDLQTIITAMSIEQNTIISFLRSKGLIVNSTTAEFDIARELQAIIADASLVYVVCKSMPNYIVDGNLSLPETQHLLREWRLAVSSFGKLVIINGVSSCGASTFAAQAQPYGFNIIIVDQTAMTHFDNNNIAIVQDNLKEPTFQVLIFDLMWHQAKVHLLRGENVMIDAVLSSDEQIDLFKQRFFGFNCNIILMHVPLEENLVRCMKCNGAAISANTNNWCDPSIVIEQYMEFYKLIHKNNILEHQKPIGIVSQTSLLNIIAEIYSNTKQLADHYYPLRSTKHNAMLNKSENTISKLKLDITTSSGEDLFVIPQTSYNTLMTPAYERAIYSHERAQAGRFQHCCRVKQNRCALLFS